MLDPSRDLLPEFDFHSSLKDFLVTSQISTCHCETMTIKICLEGYGIYYSTGFIGVVFWGDFWSFLDILGVKKPGFWSKNGHFWPYFGLKLAYFWPKITIFDLKSPGNLLLSHRKGPRVHQNLYFHVKMS